ncbi:MAG: hypothetical protein MMC33_002203 [Icmadophila ericetorum]|nr:hypothetical protein [Icmadophila ericetorum]
MKETLRIDENDFPEFSSKHKSKIKKHIVSGISSSSTAASIRKPVQVQGQALEPDSQLQLYREKLQKAESHISNLEQLLSATETKAATLHQLVSRQDRDVREAQESVFALMKSNAPTAEDDVVRSKVKTMRAEWRPFAKEWAVKRPPDIKESESPAILRLFQTLMIHKPMESQNYLWTRTCSPLILLNAELADFICFEIIKKPFISAYGYSARRRHSIHRLIFPCLDETIRFVS